MTGTLLYEKVGCFMPFSFLPQVIVDHLTDITPSLLKEYGVTALLMDFDNTIVPYTCDTPTAEMQQWIQMMQASGIFLCIVSNSRKNRVVRFAEAYGLDCVTHSRKPFQKGIREAVNRYGLVPEHTALVGDQIYTDVLGGNCGGLVSILITPIHLHNIWLQLRNVLEKPFIFLARKRRR